MPKGYLLNAFNLHKIANIARHVDKACKQLALYLLILHLHLEITHYLAQYHNKILDFELAFKFFPGLVLTH